jgi:hypothetical protein
MFGLRCDTADLPPVRDSRVPLTVRSRDSRSFPGFRMALEKATGDEALLLHDRQDLCDAGVRELFGAETADGTVAYVHWCVDKDSLPALQAVLNGRFRLLGANEVLFEGAYTFASQRGIGAMTNALGQILRIVRDRGATAAYTYVAGTNIPSLRGCAAAGFDLDHIRTDSSRFGRRRSKYGDVDAHAQELWRAATVR